MNSRNYLKSVLLILLGMAAAVVLFILGDMDDAPGLSFLGLALGFLLVMRGARQAGWIRVGYSVPILLLVSGAVIVVFPTALYLDGEIDWVPVPVGAILGAALIWLAVKKLRTIQK